VEENSAHSPTEEILRPPPKPHSPKDQDPEFIKAGCHLGTFVTAAVNTEEKQADIQALQGNLDSALSEINV
jgi:hypothetical protein